MISDDGLPKDPTGSLNSVNNFDKRPSHVRRPASKDFGTIFTVIQQLLIFTVAPPKSKSKTIGSNITGCRNLLDILLVQVSDLSGISYTRVTRQNVPHKSREHSMEKPCWCPCSGHQHRRIRDSLLAAILTVVPYT